MRKRALALKAEAAELGRPGRQESEPFDRSGVTEPYLTIAPSWEPILTERQKTASGRRYRARSAKGWQAMRVTMAKANISMVEFVEALSDEELVRGQLRDKNGEFKGRPPTWVPREFHRACVRELLRRGKTLWQENYLEAIRVLTKIAQDASASPAERMRAAQYVIERIEGKIPERIEVNLDAPWEGLIVNIVADVSEEQLAAGRRQLSGGPIIIDDETADEIEQQRTRTRGAVPPSRQRQRRK